ncbi:hypothetical protein Nepgr_033578 [Nepenthes gracilis]|uniref:Uncharacterized protein n=1 Tax=Nepenthes gracilis TaxID=150966 RepID=A0AAD3TM36_NEPGR|nr:hypothetical protein Nepgr_033578 [Nepenthes gracilis]
MTDGSFRWLFTWNSFLFYSLKDAALDARDYDFLLEAAPSCPYLPDVVFLASLVPVGEILGSLRPQGVLEKAPGWPKDPLAIIFGWWRHEFFICQFRELMLEGCGIRFLRWKAAACRRIARTGSEISSKNIGRQREKPAGIGNVAHQTPPPHKPVGQKCSSNHPKTAQNNRFQTALTCGNNKLMLRKQLRQFH